MPDPLSICGYDVLGRIAVGGMGTVYAAVRRGPGGFTKRVAIKQLHPNLQLAGEAQHRFASEARLAARLQHPNIVDVFGFEADGETYNIVMEYIHGCNLAALMKAYGRPTAALALLVVSKVLYALEAVHGRSEWPGAPGTVVHRDVSPKNILLSEEGEVKVTDFGLALIVDEGTLGSGLRGTPGYMSPEQANAETIDPRSDLYTVGIVLYELLTGRKAYPGENKIAVLRRSQLADASELSMDEVPSDLQPVLRRALARDPKDRYPDAAAFRYDVDKCLERRGRPSREALRLVVRPLAPRFSAPIARVGNDALLPEPWLDVDHRTDIYAELADQAPTVSFAESRARLITAAFVLAIVAATLLIWMALAINARY
jgi:serine/threonine-protein kinase